MKRIIDGKRYDTETASHIGEGNGTAYQGDWHYYSEDLYRTPRGNFFLCGEGGPLTKYGRPAVGGGTIGGSGIIPLTPDEALSWCEEHLDPEDYEGLFEGMIEEA